MSLIGKIQFFFKEAVNFFRRKENLGTKAWDDIWEAMHDDSFVVAGAMEDALVEDLRKEVDRALSQGTQISVFRENFDKIVAKHGWEYNGGQAWRTRIIFETNLNQSYMAGRYKQMMALSKTHKWWLYKHSDSVHHPRTCHKTAFKKGDNKLKGLDGICVRSDDPWWDYYFPSNGWGCQCRVQALNERQMKKYISDRDGVSIEEAVADIPPKIEWVSSIVGARGANPQQVLTPKCIDPGFAYTPGKSTWQKLQKELGL